jgi:hypothetical protein
MNAFDRTRTMKRRHDIAPHGAAPWLLDGLALAACAVIVFAFALAPAGI